MAYIFSPIVEEQSFVPELASDGSNKELFYCPDVVGSHRFAQNYGGYPRSDISLINEQTNMQLAQQMLQQLMDYGSSDSPNAGLSDAEIMMSHKSKYCQSPSELIRYYEDMIDLRNSRQASKASESAKEGSIKFDNNDSPNVE